MRQNFNCQASVIEDAYGACSDLNLAFLTIFDSNNTQNVTYTYSPNLDPSENAKTIPLTTTQNQDGTQNFGYKIIFNQDFLNTATDMMVATVAIHENLHAMLRFFRANQFIYSMNDNPTYDQLLTCYYETLVEAGDIPFMPNGFHHDFMTQFTDDIADALKAYGISKGYNFPYSYYKALSWSGLHETPIFNTIYPEFNVDGSANIEREYILGTILAEQENMPALDQNGQPYLNMSGNPIISLSQKCQN